MTRRGWTIEAPSTDPYLISEKLSEPSVCGGCGVVYEKGRFKWLKTAPEQAEEITCPACQRIRDDAAGGLVVLRGDFIEGHPKEILNLIENTANEEKANHPLERLIAVLNLDDRIEVTTTYEHLARRIGEAIQHAYKGELRMHYADDEKLIRVQWQRN
ncbi:MAG: BCAM0308 family protein [Candidatus Sericytochromatia bacterium]